MTNNNGFNQMLVGNNNPVQQRSSFPSYFNPQPTTTPTNNIVWVQGIEGAKAWQLNPNSMIILLDSETEGKMYIKVSDNIGLSTLRIFNYVEEVQTPSNASNSNIDLSNYVTKEELTNLLKELINEQSISTIAAGESSATNEPASNSAGKITFPKK